MLRRRKMTEWDANTVWEESRRLNEERKAVKAREESQLLESIGEVTDPLAHATFFMLERLPELQREQFLSNVLKRLTVQALHAGDALDQKHIDDMKHEHLAGMGSGITMIGIGASWVKLLINEALGEPEQTEFDFKQA